MSVTAPAANAAVVQHKPLAPLDLQQTKAAMDLYQRGLQSLLDDTDRQKFNDRKGDSHEFVKRSGWRKIATWFELSLETRSIEVDRDPKGAPIRARVICRAIAPNGRYAEGEGACDKNERSFSKLEHDLQATAATRALNRAISNLVGMGAVSAEEVETGDAGETVLPFGPLATEDEILEAAHAVQKAFPDVDGSIFMDLLAKAQSWHTTGLPAAAAIAIRVFAWWLEHEPRGHAENTTEPQVPQES